MKNDYGQSILESCLEEAVGGVRPPDLSQRILSVWADRQFDSSKKPVVDLDEPPVGAIVGGTRPMVVVEQSVESEKSADPSWMTEEAPRERTLARLLPYLAAAALMAGVALGSFWLWRPGRDAASRRARLDASRATSTKRDRSSDESPDGRRPDRDSGERRDRKKRRETPAVQTRRAIAQDRGPSVAQESSPRAQASARDQRPAMPARWDPKMRRHGPMRLGDDQIVAHVNSVLADMWRQNSIEPAAAATDAEWCRRVFLRVLGRIPTVDEVNRFFRDRSHQKRENLMDQLLASSSYAEGYARHWSVVWANVLIGRRGGMKRQGPGDRDGLLTYLRSSILSNTPYDQMAYELISAVGTATPGAADFNGAVNFLLSSWNDKGTLATARVSRIFLGQQLRCAQCHNHPSADWQQQEFWQLAAFFRQIRVDRKQRAARLTNQDFHGEGQGSEQGEIYYEQANGHLRVAYPVFPGGQPAPRDGRLAVFDRRTALAGWIARSPQLPRAVVNRMWEHFFGYGLAHPVDDLRPDQATPFAELIDYLADQFKAHEYDLKQLNRWIALTNAFGLSSRLTNGNRGDVPETGQPWFSRYYTRQLEPEEVYQSLLVAANTTYRSPLQLARDRQAWLGQVVQTMGTDSGEEQTTFDGGIRQSLLMMNGDLVRKAVRADQGSVLAMVAHSSMSADEKIEHLFLASVSRKPTSRERKLARRMLNQRPDGVSALQDIWWALLNSNEFILDH